MRPASEGAGRSLAGDRVSAEGRTSTDMMAEPAEVGKQAALHVWCIEFAVNLQCADVSLLALGFVGVAR